MISPRRSGLPLIEVLVQSSTFAVRDALDRFLTALAPLCLDIEEHTAVEMVLAEALNNIVEHAYSSVPNSGPIRITGDHHHDGLHIHIVDEGVATPDSKLPIGLAPAVNLDIPDLPEGGFGWFLIKDIAKDVVYARVGHENQLKLRVAVALHA